MINNLVPSFLWHRLAVVDPLSDLLSRVHTVLIDFFWDRLHWLPQVVLFLPKEERGQGLVHLTSRRAVFRLQFIHQLLYCPQDLVWRPLAHLTLQSIGGLGLQEVRPTARVTTLGALLEATGPDLQETTELEARLGWRSKRNVERLPSHWRVCLMGQERQLLRELRTRL